MARLKPVPLRGSSFSATSEGLGYQPWGTCCLHFGRGGMQMRGWLLVQHPSQKRDVGHPDFFVWLGEVVVEVVEEEGGEEGEGAGGYAVSLNAVAVGVGSVF